MRWLWILAALLGLAACQEAPPPAPARVGHYAPPATVDLPPEALPGGLTTHLPLQPGTRLSAEAFSRPASNLDARGRALFTVGNSFFTSPWVLAPASVAARDGLGPLFNAAACQDCHIRDGRGHPPAGPDEPLISALLRIGMRDGSPHPLYGAQIQTRAAPTLMPEPQVQVQWVEHTLVYPDGRSVHLRAPQIRLSDPAHGVLDDTLQRGLRVAPPMIGLGLLERIPAAQIRAYAAMSGGRANNVAALPGGQKTLGRFGWKAAQPTVRQQSLVAFAEDLGIRSRLIPQAGCGPLQKDCQAADTGTEPELEPQIEEAVVFYAEHLAPPARRDHDRPEVRAGEALFGELGCARCHRPRWVTEQDPQRPQLSGQTIFPYTDLLLHDMGPELADGIVEAEAGGSDWRTPPLWGLGHTQTVGGSRAGFLHDGRARTPEEAILWHGGEAAASRDAWMRLDATQRRYLLRFLGSL